MDIFFNEFMWRIDEIFWRGVSEKGLKILVLVGSSGSGKSSITNYMYNNYSEYYEVINVTTRKPRDHEEKTHSFLFLSSEEYDDFLNKGAFAWARTGKYPYYGYPKSEISFLVSNSKIGILSFHHNGAALFLRLFEDKILKAENFYFVFIGGNINSIVNHSKDNEGLTSYEKTLYEQNENSRILKKMKDLKCNVLHVINDYHPLTIASISEEIKGFISGST